MTVSKANIAMVALTSAYLCIEIPFAVQLIEIVATGNEDRISEAEQIGRVLTGTAVFIAVLGTVLVPYFRRNRLSLAHIAGECVVTGAAIIAAVYFALWGYGHLSAKQASEDTLRQSYIALIAQRDIAVTGFKGIQPDSQAADWRAFAATVSAVLNMPKVIEKSGTISDLAERETLRNVPALPEFRRQVFQMIEPRVAFQWERYVAGTNEYYQAIAEARKRPAAYREAAAREIAKQYTARSEGLRPGLSVPQFWKSETVQTKIADMIEREFGFRPKGAILPVMSDAAFNKALYVPALVASKAKIERLATGQAMTAQDREDLETAYQVATLPALALLLSLAGAALHTFKAAGYLASVSGLHRVRFMVAGSVLIAGVVAMIAHGDTITTAKAFQAYAATGIMPTLIHYAIAVQPAFEGVAKALQQTGLWSVVSEGIAYVR